MQIKMNGLVALLSADAEIGLREAAAQGDRILATLEDLGAISIKGDGGDFVPLGGRAFFDSNGCGPYDRNDL